MSEVRPQIVILGAGFAGMGVAQELSKLLAADRAEIILVDENNFLLFTPMLTEVAGGQVDPASIVAGIRATVPGARFEQGRVEAIDIRKRTVTVCVGGNAGAVQPVERTLHADHLVIALGSVTNFHDIPGLEQHSYGVKCVSDAEAIRNRVIALLERADEESDAEVRRCLLTFVVGGGGFSGVETMAAINDMVRDLCRQYDNVGPSDIRTVLIHPGERLLPEIDAGLASYAQRKLEQRGVEVRLKTDVSGAGIDYVEARPTGGSGETDRIPAHTLIWAGGVKPNPVIDSAGLKLGKHHGIVVDGCCRVDGQPNIWALGDCAEVPEPGGKKTYAPTAQNATREGKLVAGNITAVLNGEQPKPFVYHPIGELAIVGKRSGVASIYGLRISGLPAWAMWRAIYLAKLPDMPKRLRVAIDWLIDAVAGRDIAALPGSRQAKR